ncbi:MAG: helix-turn-helix transcriptional regulator [bacterium]|nr:helix-turn-helix transcriptional regulator [bacterium]
MSNLDKAFGLAVRQKRLELKFSQEDLAFESGLHRTYISQIERGIKSPSLRVISIIARALQTKVYLLIQIAEEFYSINETKEGL